MLLSKQDGTTSVTTQTLHLNEAVSQEEAVGKAIPAAMKLKPGFSIVDIVVLEIKEPTPEGAVAENPGVAEDKQVEGTSANDETKQEPA